MGPEPIEIPDYFTPVWYDQQKQQKKNDQQIADELLISKSLLDKWKRAVGCTPYTYNRVSRIDKDRLLELHRSGLNQFEIAKVLGIGQPTVFYHLKKLKA